MAFENCSLCHSTVFKPRVSVTNDVYEHLRSTNTLPENIISDIPALLSSVQKDLDDYESEIYRLQIHIADIQTRRESLRTHEENLQSLLSPIRRLPNELLTRVFGYVCIENDLRDGCPSALILGSVCLRWRQLTIGCPELWSNMAIPLFDEEYSEENFDHRRRAAFVSLCLDRSKSYPLKLSFTGGPGRNDGSNNPIFKPLAQQSFRWKHVSFYTESDLSPQIYPAFDSLDLPILDTLDLSSSHPHDLPYQCSLEMFKNTPVLHAFRASEMDCHWDRNSGFPLPSARTTLRDLSYDGKVGNFYEILDNCPDIHRLSVNPGGPDATLVARPPRLLSELYFLSLLWTSTEETTEASWLPSVLSSLTAPNLTNLVIQQFYNPKHIAPFYAIQSFLVRSSCSLRILTLENIAMTDSELVTILKQCATLEALHIVDKCLRGRTPSVITKAFIESLHSSKRSSIQTSLPPIVKSLRSLSLTVGSSDFDTAVFVGMISSRWIPNPDMAKTIGISCLRSVELFLPPKMAIDKNAYRPLLPFEKAGMMIVVKQENAEGYVF